MHKQKHLAIVNFKKDGAVNAFIDALKPHNKLDLVLLDASEVKNIKGVRLYQQKNVNEDILKVLSSSDSTSGGLFAGDLFNKPSVY